MIVYYEKELQSQNYCRSRQRIQYSYYLALECTLGIEALVLSFSAATSLPSTQPWPSETMLVSPIKDPIRRNASQRKRCHLFVLRLCVAEEGAQVPAVWVQSSRLSASAAREAPSRRHVRPAPFVRKQQECSTAPLRQRWRSCERVCVTNLE